MRRHRVYLLLGRLCVDWRGVPRLLTKVLDQGYVNYIEHWGSDERIIEAARMSTAKGFLGWPQDEKLLRFLWTNQHHTPFEMAGLTIEVQAPIFVFREWHRHRTQSYNELSARYTELPDLYYRPSFERMEAAAQSAINKQSSGGKLKEEIIYDALAEIDLVYAKSRRAYETLLHLGVAREVARTVVPVGQYSRMRASANLRNWLHFLTLRTGGGAQWEIRQYADVVAKVVEEKFPRTYALWSEK